MPSLAELLAQQPDTPAGTESKSLGDMSLSQLLEQASGAPVQAPESWKDYGLGLLSSAVRGPTFGLSTKVIPALGSLGAVFTDETVPEAYARITDQQQATEDDFRARHPYQSIGSEIAGAMTANPMGLVRSVGVRVPAVANAMAPLAREYTALAAMAPRAVPAARAALEGATGGAIYNASQAGDEDPLAAAEGGAVAGGAINAGLSLFSPQIAAAARALGGRLTNAANRTELAALGIGERELAKDLKRSVGRAEFRATGQRPIERAVEELRPTGLSSMGSAEEKVAFAQNAIDDLSAQVNDIINQADAAVAGQGQIITTPTFQRAQAYVNSLKGTVRERMQAALDRETAALLANDLDGSFGALQEAKIAYNKLGYNPTTEPEQVKLFAHIADDLRETINEGVDGLANMGVLPAEHAGMVRALNRQEGNFLKVMPSLVRQQQQETTQTIGKTLSKYIRTSGAPFGVPAIYGAASGHPLLGVLAGTVAAGLNSPLGQRATMAVERGLGDRLTQFAPEAAQAVQAGALRAGLLAEVGSPSEAKADVPPFDPTDITIGLGGRKALEDAGVQFQPTSFDLSSLGMPMNDAKPVTISLGGVDTNALLDAVRQVESGGGKHLRSPKGALGPYQFMPATAKELGIADPMDEEQSRAGALKYLTQLYKQFGDIDLALMAYNWGPGNMQKYIDGKIDTVPDETQSYIVKIKNLLGAA